MIKSYYTFTSLSHVPPHCTLVTFPLFVRLSSLTMLRVSEVVWHHYHMIID